MEIAKYGHNADQMFGYMDKEGQYLYVPQFDWASSFREGLARVNKDDKWFFIDRQGIVIETNYDWVGDFWDGLAIVDKRGKRGYINNRVNW